jgi:hypothetical protein
MNIMQETKLILSPQIARYLLKRGFPIKDIKPDKKDENKTVFIFKYDDGLFKAIQDYKEERI